ncbi:hypothetical protein BDW22DRAFT_1361143 [Trametopsis cervina]|nr:hypothetical protein BDW22DRAFT_1361143 [Trametopsis cervina]
MSTQDTPPQASLDDSLSKLHISHPPTIQETEPNPWQGSSDDVPKSQDNNAHVGRAPEIPDLSLLDTSAASGFTPEPEPTPQPLSAKQEILEEFDPLASHEEKAAKEAWETSDSHPPPPPPPADESKPPPVPAKNVAGELPSRPSSPMASFPSLAALARTFALPLTAVRQRPRSLDTATAVPSPSTLSSFASQQQQPRTPSHPATPLNVDSGRNTPITRPTSNDGDPPQFDFQRFLEQMKVKSAEPVAKYLRSFLSNFAKRTFTVGDQVKLINDFLNFISVKMREADVWKHASDAEFENAMEGMEKLVMNRLYDYTFIPQVARMIPPRPVTADDLERDRVLEQRIALFSWLEPHHLDIPEGHGREGFLMFAQQELFKVNHYKAPRDKLICILNCCKVIFGLIRHLRKEEGADSFIPILIYVVLKANPEHLLSNIEFINRFRNPAKLQSEAGYYLSSLMGAVSFIETMDHTSLSNITQEEFEKNVEEAIQGLPSPGTYTPDTNTPASSSSTSLPQISSHTGEESAQPLALPTPAQTISEDAKRLIQKTGDTISKPLAAIGRIFNEVLEGAEESLTALSPFELAREAYPQGEHGPRTPATGDASASFAGQQQHTPYKPRVRRMPSSNPPSDWEPEDTPVRPHGPHTHSALAIGPSQPVARVQNLLHAERGQLLHPPLRTPSPGGDLSRAATPQLDIAGMQHEIDRVHENATAASRETLKQIFPDMDAEIMDLVLQANDGDLGKSIEALLEMSSGG